MSVKLDVADIVQLVVTPDPAGGGVISALGPDSQSIELRMSGEALTKLEAFLVQANLEQAKLQQMH